jgi:hypothetical protein
MTAVPSRAVVAALALVGCASAACADVVVPNAYTSSLASTSGLNTFIRDSGNPRTGQLLIAASQLGAVAGQQIAGLTFRLYTGAAAAYPATNATWADYSINIGQGVAFGSQTTTFATNFVGSPTNVRSGPLTINAGSFTSGLVPNAFGTTIMFDTPYTYTGGNLLIEVRHTGSNIVNTSTDFLEVALTTDPGYNSAFWSATATGNAATVGAAANFTVTKLVVIPSPAGAAVLGLAGFAASRRRRA